ncbi:MAG TPA: PEGA domain-containing protein [Polyangia bacterium]|nr:PEGA domain-containing protein [Polyangia bacterium]
MAAADAPRPTGPLPHAAIDVPQTEPTPEPKAPATRPAPATVTLQVESQPVGAAVWIGDAAEPRGRTPLRLVVPKGQGVRATLKADGYVDREVALDTDHDQTIDVRLNAAEQPHHAHVAAAHGGHRAGHAPPPTADSSTPEPAPKPDSQKKYFLLGD